MPNIGVISFNAGKLTPLIDVRSDTEKFSSGCRILDNSIPIIHGPATRWPGTKKIARVHDDNVKSRMIDFIFSATIAYKLEFSDKVINVYFEETLVEENIVSPYLEADLFQLQVKQSADVMWIVHPSYQSRKLSRVSPTEFSLDVIPFESGPFIKRNDIVENDGVTIAATGYTIATVTDAVAGSASITVTFDTAGLAAAAVLLLPENQRFYITGSTAGATNIDAAYTVDPLRATTSSGVTLTINATEAITSDPATNGEVHFDGGKVTLTASDDVFVSGDSSHVDALFKLTHKRLKTVTKGTQTGETGVIGEAIDVKGSWTFNTTGHWDATVEIQRLEDGTNWETFKTFTSIITNDVGSRNVQQPGIEEANGVQYRINVTAYTAGSIVADLTVNNSTQESIFKITAVASGTSVTATAIIAAPDNVAATRWAEGSWSSVRGYPSAITFFGERSVYGYTNSDQQTIWLSEVDEFEDFEAGLNASDSFAIRIPTANRGRWLGSLDILAAGTTGDEWRIRATTIDAALTPKNFEIKRQTKYGGANIQAREVNDAIIFIDSVARKVREYTFSEPKQKYVAPDLTALAEDITSGGITSIAVQTHPDSILWFTIADSPYLISMTYEREQDVVAFANHPVGGNGIVESVIVTPSAAENVITLSVKRTINGETVRTIEDMQPRRFGNIEDAFFVDAGVIDTLGNETVGNLGHLEGEEVVVLVDGAVQARKTVSDGQITLTASGDKAIVGLPYLCQVSPMRLDSSTREGVTHGSIKNIPEIVVSFFESGNIRYGNDKESRSINFRTIEDYDSPPALFTGDKTLDFISGFSTEDNIVISTDDPLPCTVRAIIARMEKTGR